MEDIKLIEKLDKYCKKHGYAHVASKLGYNDSGTIRRWIERKSIPDWQLNNVKKMMVSK